MRNRRTSSAREIAHTTFHAIALISLIFIIIALIETRRAMLEVEHSCGLTKMENDHG